MRVHSQRGTLIAVAVIIAGGAVAGLLLGRAQTGAAGSDDSDVSVAASAPVAVADGTAAPGDVTGSAVVAMSDAVLARLAQDAMVGPRDSRLAAIRQLSQAPREQALPPLKQVLLNGEPGYDRPAALTGLRDLALAQGDGDQRIRDAVREVIYHGDDESLSAAAQETIDAISRAAEPPSSAN
ncbi:MAG TPA: hypothetical protein VMF52_16360 [Steroidobacteraceae bacterium]|nr:hypothetical protein [Steroidobacteraceae bacterium]